MKRTLEIVFSSVMICSFFLPWIPYMDMISSTPLTGWYFTLIMLFFGFMGTLRGNPTAFLDFITAICLISSLILCGRIIFSQSKTIKRRVKELVTLFMLSWGIFVIQIAVSTGLGMTRGLTMFKSLKHQLSFTCYGIYVGLIASLLLLILALFQQLNRRQ